MSASVFLVRPILNRWQNGKTLHQQLVRNCHIKHKPIRKVLIANRGEIACRVMKTARKMGIQTVAVFSDADRHSMHVAMADEAYHIGPAAVQQSYLRGDKVLEAATNTGAHAVHPGYGFLSENTEFAELCENKGIIFIGPPASAIRDMGIKSTSKHIMSEAGVPIVGGYHGDDQSPERLLEEARKIKFPVMIKAVRGGGGKGMRIAMTEDEFSEQLNSAKTEAMKSFGDQIMLIEKYVQRPRHVEVQIFGDRHDNYVYLFERDCSVQRRHQKVIEEAPGPGITAEIRKRLGEAAVKAARAVKYVGAGTVEFILDPSFDFYFMEMNTRLQVEHPVTEMITGTDLVEWQLRVAAGEKLPVTQDDLYVNGHSFEARIYAEDPSSDFLPGAGTLKRLVTPASRSDLRVETGVRESDEVTVHYDPMIAKLVVWGEDRYTALTKLSSSLSEFNVVGLNTNIKFLQALCNHSSFQDGDVHTDFIPQHHNELFPHKMTTSIQYCQAALASILFDCRCVKDEVLSSSDPTSPWQPGNTLRFNHDHVDSLYFEHKDDKTEVQIVHNGDHYIMNVSGEQHIVEGKLQQNGDIDNLIINIDGNINSVRVLRVDNAIHLFTSDDHLIFEKPLPKYLKEKSGSATQGGNVSPMPGVVEKICVEVGQEVKAGDPLVVIIAMKMEYVIKSSQNGKVEKIHHQAGASVPKGAPLVKIASEE